ncbi:MAG: helix-hairpin-helix domain-containing protein [Methylococcaceae bacterium]|nr:helix-hairpin-helix domain-containing protein [Methylococcaceae bacterium]
MFKKGFLSIAIAFLLFTGVVFAGDTVNVNTANMEQLQSINGIGESTATAIIEYREMNGSFSHVSDLVNVKGIGEKKLAKLREQISVNNSEE